MIVSYDNIKNAVEIELEKEDGKEELQQRSEIGCDLLQASDSAAEPAEGVYLDSQRNQYRGETVYPNLPPKSRTPCRYHFSAIHGCMKKKCEFSHDPSTQDLLAEWYDRRSNKCKFFMQSRCTRDDCQYVHNEVLARSRQNSRDRQRRKEHNT